MVINYIEIYSLKNDTFENTILGVNNKNIDLLCELMNIDFNISHSICYINEVDLDEKDELIKIISFLEQLIECKINFSLQDLIVINKARIDHKLEELLTLIKSRKSIISLANGKSIYPKTFNQSLYINNLQTNDIVFGVGPAGTGKTFLAIMFASSLLKKNIIKEIVLVRPVVEAGEKLGFLPGDLKEKIDPYLIPLYDALNECFGKENVTKMVDKGLIEIAPLAYMRGRTLDNSVIILDEAQNATRLQMKMFLTRLGFNSKMIITGDISQIDLPNKRMSGLVEAINILDNIKGLSIVKFNEFDVMRHPLVYKIVNRYNKYEEENEN